MARVIALQRGHDGRVVREEGEEFEIADERLLDGSSWFAAADPAVHKRITDEANKRAAKNKKQPPGAGPKAGSNESDAVPPGAGPKGLASDLA